MSTCPVVLVTGGARRIGAVIVQTLWEAGYRVVIHHHHSQAESAALVHRLNQSQKDSAVAFCADFNEFADLAPLVTAAHNAWGRLDVLVNNASSFFPTPVGATAESDWNDLINTNLKAPYFLAQAAAEHLAATQGCIINIADIHGERPLKNYPVYSAAEAGLLMLTQALARELAPAVRVNAVAPGVTLLPDKKPMDAATINDLTERTVLKRFARPEDIAEAVLFLIRQSAITGQVLNIDCGRSLRQ
jgi:pteridine reductase